MRRLIVGFACLLPVIGSAAVAPAARGQEMELGLARVDITPDYPVRLHGYGLRSKESVGVAQRIWAKALAIGSDAEGPRVLVSVDNLGVSDAIVEEIAGRLTSRARIPRDRFAVASSHTHSALASRASRRTSSPRTSRRANRRPSTAIPGSSPPISRRWRSPP